MRPMRGRVVVTGGLGFIGSAVVRRLVARGDDVTNLDAGTYAADPRRIPEGIDTRRVDVAADRLDEHFAGARVVVHLAAETHVTRSETDETAFFRTNVDGTRAVLDAARSAGVELVVHFSTDEVYGPALEVPFTEDDKLPGEGRATSAYARSKALADDLALAYDDVHVVVLRPANCFGPWQHPEKAIARWTTRALAGHDLPVWGDGRYVRDWTFVDDVCDAVDVLVDRAPPAGAYNAGAEGEPVANVDIAQEIARLAGRDDDAVYLTAYDRPSHDRRYSIDSSKLRALGWEPRIGVKQGLRTTVEWYRVNRSWWEPLVREAEAIYDDRAAR